MGMGDVLEVLSCLRDAGVGVWIDGGWGIDALLGEQSREHDDLDVTILLTSSSHAAAALAALGFVVVEDERPTRFVVRDDHDRRIDFHTITFDEMGRGWQRLQDGSRALYPWLRSRRRRPRGHASPGRALRSGAARALRQVRPPC
jgi:lincosamide nucleotidyltransferase A/C/D/E